MLQATAPIHPDWRRAELVDLADVNAMEVICPEGGVALGALPLPSVVARLDALEAEDVEAFCQDGVLHPGVAARAR